MVNILYITRAYSEHAGGMERLSWEFSQALRENKEVSLEVIAYTGQRLFSPLFNLVCLADAFKRGRTADVIHIGDPILSFAGWILKRFLHKPVVVTVHGLDVTYPNPLYRLYLRLFFRNFDSYLPISAYTAKLLRAKNVHGEAEVITPGICDRYKKEGFGQQGLERVVGRSLVGKISLLTVGRLVSRKGQAWFVSEVLPKLPPQFVYLIAGTGPDYKNIKKAAQEHGVENRVMLLGRVSGETLAVLYNTVDAFIQPNISAPGDVEGFGLVLLEAALCERKVFASRLEGMTDAISDGQNGCLLPSGDTEAWRASLTAFG